jgi:hypothetical protein
MSECDLADNIAKIIPSNNEASTKNSNKGINYPVLPAVQKKLMEIASQHRCLNQTSQILWDTNDPCSGVFGIMMAIIMAIPLWVGIIYLIHQVM